MARRSSLRKGQLLRKLLRQIRLEAKLRQADMSKKLGRPQSFVSKYESGERKLDLVEIEEICIVANISLAEFIRRYEEDAK